MVRLVVRASVFSFQHRNPVGQTIPCSSACRYNADGSEFAQGIGCLVRGDPDKFKESSLAVELVDPLETRNLLGDYEELVSDIIKIYSAHGDEELQVTHHFYRLILIISLGSTFRY